MKFLDKLERSFGRFAIKNIMKYVAMLYGIGLVISILSVSQDYEIYNLFYLNFDGIKKGEVWRLITFMIPMVTLRSLIWDAITVYVYYMIGNALERVWGSFRMNLYFISGLLFNVLSSFIVYKFVGIRIPPTIDAINQTLFFAFAAIYPNTQFLIYFLIPVKAKYLAWFQGVMYAYNAFTYLTDGIPYTGYLIIPMVVSIANFLIFFLATRNYKKLSPREFQRKANYRKQTQAGRVHVHTSAPNINSSITRHKCAVCGRTERDDDMLEFRFCSKCDGNYEYCMEHLFTHEHVKR